MGDVFTAGLERWSKPYLFNPSHNLFDLGHRQNRGRFRFDIPGIAEAIGNIFRHFRLKRNVSDKNDEGMYLFFVQAEQRFKRSYMLEVLMQRVLKLERVPINLLRPRFLMGTPEYPTFHILGFNDKHAEYGNNDVVDLRGPITGRERHVFYQAIFVLI